MKKYILPLLIAVAGIILGGYFLLMQESDPVKVRKTIKSFCRMGSKSESDGAAGAMVLISRTREIFADEFSVQIREAGLNGKFNPTKMTSELARCRAIFSSVKLDAEDMEISFPEPGRALVFFTGVLDGKTKSGRRISEARDVECRLVLTEGKWKIVHFQLQEILAR